MQTLKYLIIPIFCLIGVWPSGEKIYAEEVRMGISFSIPPYVITENDSGIETEIIREAFAIRDHKVIFLYLPQTRAFRQFERGKTDGIINIRKDTFGKAFCSDVVITFHNHAVSLKKNAFELKHIKGLRSRRVTAFQKASVLMGREFGKTVKANKDYREVADQSVQIRELFFGHTDFVVMDRNIFMYYRKKVLEELRNRNIAKASELEQEVIFHDIFPESPYRFAFNKEKLRNDFDYGLKKIRENGTYSQIIKKYDKMMDIKPDSK